MRHFSSVPTRRAAALFSASALAAAALVATAGSAGAVITQGPGTDPTGAPLSFRDAEGVGVGLCVDPVNCAEPVDPAEPPVVEPVFPTEADSEASYFAAEAQAGPVLAIFGVEALSDGVAITTANMYRFRGDLAANTQYRIRHPWGTANCLTEDDGELDCLLETGGEAGGTVGAGPVKTFLRQTNAPAGFLGSLAAPSTVTGSPTGFNRVVVTGPNGNVVGRTNLFAVAGQMSANTAMTSVGADALNMRATAAGRQRVIRYSSFGTANATPQVVKAGANPGRFAVNTSACASVAPQAACNIRVTYLPQNNRTATARLRITDNSSAAARVVTLRGTGTDTRRARVAASTPRRGQRVGVNKNVSARFNEAVRGVKKSSFTLTNQSNGNKVRGSVSRVGQTNRYVLNPRRSLDRGTTYRVRLVGGKAAIRDLAGNPLRTKAWKFRTR